MDCMISRSLGSGTAFQRCSTISVMVASVTWGMVILLISLSAIAGAGRCPGARDSSSDSRIGHGGAVGPADTRHYIDRELGGLGRILRASVGRGGAVFGGGALFQFDAADLPRQLNVIAAGRELRALHRQRTDRHQRRAVEILEHEQSSAPVREIEVANDAADLEAIMWL